MTRGWSITWDCTPSPPRGDGGPHFEPGGGASTGPAVHPEEVQATFRNISYPTIRRGGKAEPDMSPRKQPSEFLAAMLKLCPKRQENCPSSHFSSCIVTREL